MREKRTFATVNMAQARERFREQSSSALLFIAIGILGTLCFSCLYIAGLSAPTGLAWGCPPIHRIKLGMSKDRVCELMERQPTRTVYSGEVEILEWYFRIGTPEKFEADHHQIQCMNGQVIRIIPSRLKPVNSSSYSIDSGGN